MPNMSNITVKKADDTSDQVYTGVNPAGGDGIPAIFRAQDIGDSPVSRPEIRVSSRSSKIGRVVRVTAHYPSVTTVAGVTTVVPGCKMSCDFQLNEAQPTSQALEAATQFPRFLADALIRECFSTGFSPV